MPELSCVVVFSGCPGGYCCLGCCLPALENLPVAGVRRIVVASFGGGSERQLQGEVADCSGLHHEGLVLVQLGAVASDAGASLEVLGVGRHQRHFAGVFTLVERLLKGFGQALVGVGLSVSTGLFCTRYHRVGQSLQGLQLAEHIGGAESLGLVNDGASVGGHVFHGLHCEVDLGVAAQIDAVEVLSARDSKSPVPGRRGRAVANARQSCESVAGQLCL
jgi:hypothetical protein